MPENKMTCPHCSKEIVLSEQEVSDIMSKEMNRRFDENRERMISEMKQQHEEDRKKMDEMDIGEVDEVLDLQLENFEEILKKHPERKDELYLAISRLRDCLK